MDPRLQAVADALRAGNTFEAIRLLRDATGMSFPEAKAEVERLLAEGEARSASDAGAAASFGSAVPVDAGATSPADDLGIDLQRDLAVLRQPRDPNVVPLDPALADEVAALAATHKYIDAIKLVRARTGADLKTAKDQVELVMEQRGIAKQSSRGCIIVLIAILVIILAGAIAAFLI